jgi:signal transduction histidine kinase
MSRLIQAQEEERKRIAGDIHDDSVQVMAAVQLRLASLARAKSESDRDQALQYLDETVRLSIMRLRRLMFELRPASLDREGLTSALKANLELMSREIGIEHSVHSSLAEEPPLETRVVLYRIAQEALANIRKHSLANRVSVQLGEHLEGILVRISDDGAGFVTGTDSPAGHLGLAAMRERADDVSGWVQIDSAPGEGTTVNIWVPWQVATEKRFEQVGAV